MSTILQTLDRLHGFRPLWPGLVRILSQMAQLEPDEKEVKIAIMGDPVLAAMTLRLANSASLPVARTVTDVGTAIVRVGIYPLLRSIATEGLKDMLGKNLPQYGYDENTLWRHSMSAAVSAQCAADMLCPELKGPAYTTGLLHDIGKLALGRIFSNEVAALVKKSKTDEGLLLHENEIRIFGFSHAELGESLARRWGLPELLCDAVGKHHSSCTQQDEKEIKLADLVQLGDVISHSMGEGVGDGGTMVSRSTQAWQDRMGLDRGRFESLCATSLVEFQTALKAFSR